MRILVIGDIVGKPGRRIVTNTMAALKEKHSLDCVIANAENAADGSGITPSIYRELKRGGVHAVTLGDHIYRRKEIADTLQSADDIVKPANYPPSAPGKEWCVVEADNGTRVAVISLMGRVFMRPVDCPWTAADRVLAQIPEDVVVRIVDFHGEATSDKQLAGRYLDGRVSAVLGTHTHVATADEQILPNGTAFQCDLGMTGPHSGILGRSTEPVMEATLTFHPQYFKVAKGDVRMHGSIIDIDPATGKAGDICRLVVDEDEAFELSGGRWPRRD